MQPIDLASIGIGPDDTYRNDDGELRLKPDICHHSDPPYLEECWGCFWFDGDTGDCRYTQDVLNND